MLELLMLPFVVIALTAIVALPFVLVAIMIKHKLDKKISQEKDLTNVKAN